jgi:hypothetical protein
VGDSVARALLRPRTAALAWRRRRESVYAVLVRHKTAALSTSDNAETCRDDGAGWLPISIAASYGRKDNGERIARPLQSAKAFGRHFAGLLGCHTAWHASREPNRGRSSKALTRG